MKRALKNWSLLLLAGVIFISSSLVGFAAPKISAEQAQNIALAKTGAGTVTKCKLDIDDGIQEYEVKIVTTDAKFEVDIDASTGAIRSFQKKLIVASSNPSNASIISPERAQTIALAQTKSGVVLTCKLDYENGVLVYEVDVMDATHKYSFDIQASNGTILKSEKKAISKVPATGLNGYITVEKATQIALAKVPGGTVLSTEMDYDDGIMEYEIKISTGTHLHELDINAKDGTILKHKQKAIKNGGVTPPAPATPTPVPPATTPQAPSATGYIGEAKAKQIAINRVGGGMVTKIKLDHDDGIMQYEIEIRNGNWEYDIDIDARTGAILSFDADFDD